MAQPVAVDRLLVPVEKLLHVPLWAAIDKGGSLLKIIFVPKEESKNVPEGFVSLQCFSYLNDDFQDAIEFMLSKMRMPCGVCDASQFTLRVTGVGFEKEMETLRKMTPFKIHFVDEFLAHGVGHNWMLRHFDLEDTCYNSNEIRFDPALLEKCGFYDNCADSNTRKVFFPAECDIFPCLVVFLGSAGGFLKIEANGDLGLCGGTVLAGKYLLSMAHLLVETADYDELMSLAERGERRNTDTLAKDAFCIRDDTPSNHFVPDIPFFPFGKATDLNKSLKDFRKEDLAASLVNVVAGNLASLIMTTALAHKVQNIFIGGNLCRSLYFRKMMIVRPTIYSGMFNIRFLKSGHTAAMGAMIAGKSSENRLLLQ